ncbi:hypothetical protein VB264_05185 [Arcicella aquatica]|uniref:Uncharacterized protein n=1 Tax=Arcicella aquatica TaxID=217141 RepID=A0ABU5QK59_9BACT|nr:hypothetical protein [Arcicella aquatica]MEA5257170.1 hypothetical protein [Arcicella aquatica]
MKSILFLSVLTLSVFWSCLNEQGVKPSIKTPNAESGLQKVAKITYIKQQIDTVERFQEGLCDTCVASYKAVIIENRLLAKRISEQNFEMQKMILHNDSIINAPPTFLATYR